MNRDSCGPAVTWQLKIALVSQVGSLISNAESGGDDE